MAVVGQADGHIGLAATEDDVELVGLNETAVASRRQTKHKFP